MAAHKLVTERERQIIFTRSRIRLSFYTLNRCSLNMQRDSSDKTYYYMEINKLNQVMIMNVPKE